MDKATFKIFAKALVNKRNGEELDSDRFTCIAKTNKDGVMFRVFSDEENEGITYMVGYAIGEDGQELCTYERYIRDMANSDAINLGVHTEVE